MLWRRPAAQAVCVGVTPRRSVQMPVDTTSDGPRAARDFDARRYWDRRLARNWTLQGVGLSRLSRKYNVWAYRARRAVFLRTVRGLGMDLARADVLDVASGTGFYVDLWDRLGVASVTGVDIADSAVDRLRRRFSAHSGVRIERLDITMPDLSPLSGDAYDVVSAFDVLFHITDDDGYRRAFSNVHQLLRPGGRFVFSEHFVHAPRRAGHVASRHRAEIERIAADTGFELLSRRPMLVLMSWPAGARRAWRRKLYAKLIAPAAASERWGGVIGAALYPLELILARLLSETAATHITVCRRT